MLTTLMPPRDGLATKTRITGFFNPHSYPIQLQLNELGLNLTVSAGKFIKDDDGKNVNDPAIAVACGPNGLGRQEGKTEVPVLFVVRPNYDKKQPEHQHSFAGSSVVKTDGTGRLTELPGVPTSEQRAISARSVSGYSIEQAQKLGIVKHGPKVEPPEGVKAKPAPVEERLASARLEEPEVAKDETAIAPAEPSNPTISERLKQTRAQSQFQQTGKLPLNDGPNPDRPLTVNERLALARSSKHKPAAPQVNPPDDEPVIPENPGLPEGPALSIDDELDIPPEPATNLGTLLSTAATAATGKIMAPQPPTSQPIKEQAAPQPPATPPTPPVEPATVQRVSRREANKAAKAAAHQDEVPPLPEPKI